MNILARQTLASARSLTRQLRWLRLSVVNCSTCTSRANCPVPADFNAQLAIVLQEIAEEWQLS